MDLIKVNLKKDAKKTNLDPRQVQSCGDARSVSGSLNSHISRKSVAAQCALQEAELEERLVQKEVELELRLLRARSEVERQRIRVEKLRLLEEDECKDQISVAERTEKVDRYLEDCGIRLGENLAQLSTHESRDANSYDLIANVAANLELPKLELLPFDGDPVKYWRFIRMFDSYVESRTRDDRQRMLFLLHYCTGKARESIEECVMLSPTDGYKQARETLRELFGQPYQVARRLINGLIPLGRNVFDDPESLSLLGIRMRNCETALTQMNYVADLNSITNIEKITKALPIRIQQRWARVVDHSTDHCREPTFHELRVFIEEEARISQSRFGQVARESEAKQYRTGNKTDQLRPSSTIVRTGTFNVNNQIKTSQPDKCPICMEAHLIETCQQFKALNVPERWSSVRRFGGCFVCLRPSHMASKCKQKRPCGIDDCKSLHHELLHSHRNVSSSTGTQSLALCGSTNCKKKQVRLGIIPVIVETDRGSFPTYAFIDGGSDTTLVKRHFLAKVGLKGTPSKLSITTVNGSRTYPCERVGFILKSLDGKETAEVERAYSVDDLPLRPVASIRQEAQKWPHLADLPFDELDRSEVCVLIGSDVPEAQWVFKQRIGGRRHPFGAKTIFGWMLCGPLMSLGNDASINCTCADEPSIVDQITMLYDHEFKDLAVPERAMSQEDKRAIDMVQSASTWRDGHLEVPIPWKFNRNTFPNNRVLASRRLIYLKRRFERDEDLFSKYSNVIQPDGIEYKRPSLQVHLLKHNILCTVLEHYSDWTRLLRAIAWFTRFKQYWMRKHGHVQGSKMRLGSLLLHELRSAELDILRVVQIESFARELEYFQGKERKNTRRLTDSSLRKLCPIVVDGLLRVGGRLSLSHYGFDTRYPIILPKRHHVVDLIVRYYHLLEGHCGTNHIISLIRQRFWIVNARAAVKRVIRSCFNCRRYNATALGQQMAPLPAVRVDASWHPFTNVGVDYFGPLTVKRGRTTEKRYGCLFTCMQSRAVHLEVAHSLSADSFIMALMRFVGRRGNPENMFSDNGTNFVAADKELKKILRDLDHSSIAERLLHRGIQWHFNPPYSSHRGGVWERLIRETRRIMLAICTEQRISDETLATVLVEVERILNNRPLVPAASDDPDQLALTPNDLLIMRYNTGLVPEMTLIDRFSRGWRQANHLITTFWKRWSKEYITSLHARQRWIDKRRSFLVGDVVLVSFDGLPRNQWPLGVVERCDKDEDGLVRALEIRTKSGLIKRDVRRVVLIEECT